MSETSWFTPPGPFGKRYPNYYAVSCPKCKAAPTAYCAPDKETSTDVGPVVHEARREAWRIAYTLHSKCWQCGANAEPGFFVCSEACEEVFYWPEPERGRFDGVVSDARKRLEDREGSGSTS